MITRALSPAFIEGKGVTATTTEQTAWMKITLIVPIIESYSSLFHLHQFSDSIDDVKDDAEDANT